MALERYWEDYAIGETFRTGGRTIVDADIRLFIGATDATHPAHVDVQYSEAHPFGRPVAQGSLIVGVVDGLVSRYLVPQVAKLAHYGYDRIRFIKPVFPGDTISLSATVADKKPKTNGFGVVTMTYDVLNQRDDVVAVFTDLQYVEMRDPTSVSHGSST